MVAEPNDSPQPLSREGRTSHLDRLGTRLRRPATAKPIAHLRITKGPGAGAKYELFVGANTLGRGNDNDVELAGGDAAVVDLQHAIVEYRAVGAQFILYDGMKAEPVYCDGTQVSGSSLLGYGQMISLGNIELRLEQIS